MDSNSSAPTGTTAAHGRHSRILLVDDVMENIQVARQILKEHRHQLNIAHNG